MIFIVIGMITRRKVTGSSRCHDHMALQWKKWSEKRKVCVVLEVNDEMEKCQALQTAISPNSSWACKSSFFTQLLQLAVGCSIDSGTQTNLRVFVV